MCGEGDLDNPPNVVFDFFFIKEIMKNSGNVKGNVENEIKILRIDDEIDCVHPHTQTPQEAHSNSILTNKKPIKTLSSPKTKKHTHTYPCPIPRPLPPPSKNLRERLGSP